MQNTEKNLVYALLRLHETKDKNYRDNALEALTELARYYNVPLKNQNRPARRNGYQLALAVLGGEGYINLLQEIKNYLQ